MTDNEPTPLREMSSWIETADRTADATPACPRCGSASAAWILRGDPAFSADLEADLASGTVVLGGCMVWPDQATHQCNACEFEFRPDGRTVRTEEDGW